MMRPVRLTPGNLGQLHVREWGIPRHGFAGKCWRSEKHWLIGCMVPLPDGRLQVEIRAVQIVDHPADQWMPVRWRAAMAIYQERWPDSAPRFRRLPWRM